MTTTHTRTHVHITFADPYLRCDQCREFVDAWHDPQQCGCDESGWQNLPCEHQAGVTTACPSWGPVDGCTCDPVDHPVPPANATGDKRR